jgi:hypothetical protein
LAFLKRLSHQSCFFTQKISTTHCYSHLLLLCLVVLDTEKEEGKKKHKDERNHKLLLVEIFAIW